MLEIAIHAADINVVSVFRVNSIEISVGSWIIVAVAGKALATTVVVGAVGRHATQRTTGRTPGSLPGHFDLPQDFRNVRNSHCCFS